MLHDNGNKVVHQLLLRYQISLETSTTGSDFISHLVQLLYYKCLKINFKRGVSYNDPPD